ncbi:MAG: TOBE domain-containing protein, partial [Actinomycetota bacterium]|nr:TOBE domain-containing protein [Actinomycetota bacterium]
LAHRLAGFSGMTVLVTHDPLDALTLADRLVFFDSGGVVQSGSPAEVVTRPRNPYVASVVGLNLLRGRAVTTESVMVRVGGGAMEVVTAEDPALVPSGTDLWVTLNPAAISLYAGQPHGSPRNTWPVTVAEVTLTGQRARVALQGPVPLMAEVTAPAVVSLGIAPGRSFWASVKATEVTAYPA